MGRFESARGSFPAYFSVVLTRSLVGVWQLSVDDPTDFLQVNWAFTKLAYPVGDEWKAALRQRVLRLKELPSLFCGTKPPKRLENRETEQSACFVAGKKPKPAGGVCAFRALDVGLGLGDTWGL